MVVIHRQYLTAYLIHSVGINLENFQSLGQHVPNRVTISPQIAHRVFQFRTTIASCVGGGRDNLGFCLLFIILGMYTLYSSGLLPV